MPKQIKISVCMRILELFFPSLKRLGYWSGSLQTSAMHFQIIRPRGVGLGHRSDLSSATTKALMKLYETEQS